MPNWIWPSSVHKETTALIRFGRVCHWIALAVAGLFGAALVFAAFIGHGDDLLIASVILPPMALVAALIGRAVRYILANE